MRIILLVGWLIILPSVVFAQGAVVAPTIDQSGTITTGGTFQQISSQTKSRRSVEFTNICSVAGACNATTDVCYIFFAASGTPLKTTDAIPVPAGWSYLRSAGTVPSDAIQATCDGTGDHFRLAVQ